LTLLCLLIAVNSQYQPNWPSIDARALPSWFDEAKVGIFLHWGVYSVPSWGTTGGAAGEWYWWRLDGDKNPDYVAFHNRTYGANFQYPSFAPRFTAELWNPDTWAELFKKSGAKYVVLTSKHHEGWTNWKSPESWNWNAVDAGPGKDLIGLLSAAVRKQGLVCGNYYSLFEWFHPLYLEDKANHFKTTRYVDEVMIPQLKDLVTKYRPDVIWSDGDWDATSEYWKSTEFLAWLYNNAPNKDTVIVNDRWGSDCSLKHGGYYSGGDRYHPGKLLGHKWEDAFTIDSTTWGFKRNSGVSDYLSPTQIIQELISTVAFGGNVLINIGPTWDGRIVPIFEERLLQLGNFLSINGEAIYKSQPWVKFQNQTDIGAFFTTSNQNLYVLMSPWPMGSSIQLQSNPKAGPNAAVVALGDSVPLMFSSNGTSLKINLPPMSSKLDPHGLVLKLSGFSLS
jgi:alpha-L-fucosidase